MLKFKDRASLPLNALRAFEASARHLSFTMAARELHVTQGAVSRQVKLLEADLKVILFHRLHRKLSLTDQGQILLFPITEALDIMTNAVETLKNQTRDLSLKVHPTFAIRWLVPRLHKFQALHPDIQIRFTTSNINADFKRENFDVAITYRGDKKTGVIRKTILEERLIPVCSPKLLNIKPRLKKPSDLKHFPLLHNSPNQLEWRTWAAQANIKGLSFERGQVFEIDDAALQAATAGLGIALGDRLLIKEDLNTGRLIAPFKYTRVKTGTYYISWPEKNLAKPGVMEFKDWLIKEII
ncbi:MAG: transcriptional regulator GcvA [Desulfobacula sp.]|nr:transcriptional regulator GcvA [Desulfobacula sp.]